MPKDFNAANLKVKTLDELKSLKLIFGCKTYDDVLKTLIDKAGYRDTLDEVARMRQEFPLKVKESVR